MTRQFATLMAANLTVVEALTALIEQTDSRQLQKTLIQVRESINEGSSLAGGFAATPKSFLGPVRQHGAGRGNQRHPAGGDAVAGGFDRAATRHPQPDHRQDVLPPSSC